MLLPVFVTWRPEDEHLEDYELFDGPIPRMANGEAQPTYRQGGPEDPRPTRETFIVKRAANLAEALMQEIGL